MSTIGSSLKQRNWVWIVAALVVAAAIAPIAAWGASTASFSARTPLANSTIKETKPLISVTAYDPYGVRGSSNFYMSIDRKSVKPTVTYIVKHTWDPAHPDYRRFKMSYRPTTALAAGKHRVYVRVKDRQGRTSSTVWYFTVEGPEAPYAAEFSNATPAPGSSSTLSTPTVSVKVYDKYGVKGTGNYALKVDETTVTTSITYAKSGVYTDFTLSHQVATPLAVGDHTLSATVTDTHGHVSTYAWVYTVEKTVPVYPEMPVTVTGCTDCHTNYPGSHPMADCVLCHGPDSPPRPPGGLYGGGAMSEYAPTDTSAHTASCQAEACHGGGGPFPHLLDSNCARCHNGQWDGIPGEHPIDVPSAHVAPASFCTDAEGCHLTSLTKEHYRYGLSCTTCHASSDPLVAQAIADGDTSCSACHTDIPPTHPGNDDDSHTANITCTSAGCHSSNVATIHGAEGGPGCVCHEPGYTTTLVCSTDGCHSSGAAESHSSHVSTQTAGIIVINGASYGEHACADCHAPMELQALHGGVDSCATCHPEPANSVPSGSFACAQGDCHAGTSDVPMHGNINAAHAPQLPDGWTCMQSGCHQAADAAALHAALPTTCICHQSGYTLTTACDTAGCHAGGATPDHDAHPATVTTGTIVIMGVSYPDVACADCHSPMELQALHGGPSSCATCHPSPRNTFAYWRGGCTQGGCHGPSSNQPMHADVNAAHTPAPIDAITCGGAGCHDVSSNVSIAVIHDGGPGCAACHDNPDHAPSNVCTDCHASHDLAAAHAATPPADDIYLSGVNTGTRACSTCHSPLDLRSLHSNECAKCHPAVSDTLGGTWLKGCAQGGCHTAGSTAPMHSGTDAAHHLTEPTGCAGTGCHGGEPDAGLIHYANGTGPGCVCHESGHTLTLDCAAADCHPGGAPSSHRGHNATVSNGWFVIKGVTYGAIACSSCHGTMELQTIHGGDTSCATCHPTPADQILDTWDGSCAQADCHAGASPNPQHGTIDTSHDATLPGGWSCTSAGCHTGAGDLAAIHAAVPGRSDNGCGICHAYPKAPTGDCQSSGCHPGGAPSSHESHPVSDSSTDLVIDGVPVGTHACSDCHSPLDLQSLHTSCATCHPAPANVSGGYACDQANCHGLGSTYAPVQHGDITSAHVVVPQPGCTATGCHSGGTDGSNAAIIHAAVPGRTDNGCGICHGPGKTPTLVCGTDGCHSGGVAPPGHESHESTTTSGSFTINGVGYGVHDCIECHLSNDLQDIHGGLDSCATCHPTPASLTTEGFTCAQSNCHVAGSSYAAAMHGTIDAAHAVSPANSGCTTGDGCHTAGDLAAIHNAGPGCAACHAGGALPASNNCGDAACHGDTTGIHFDYAKHTATPPAESIVINGVSYGPMACSTCHTVEVMTGHAMDCATCHPSPKDTLTPSWNKTCVQGGCHTPASSAPMHAQATTAHLLGSAPDCTMAGCHDGGNDVAAIHAAAGGPGCAACHGPGKTPTLVCGTAGCHEGGAPLAHGEHPVADATVGFTIDGTSVGSHACSDCHASLDLQQVHAGCSTCHEVPANLATGYACDQANCHGAGSTYAPIQHAELTSAHVVAPQPGCTAEGCHTGGTGGSNAAIIHTGVPGRTDNGCGICHGGGKTPTLVCATSGCHSAGDSYPITDSHSTIHNVTRADGCTGSACHDGTNLQTIQIGSGPATKHTSCATCHSSTDPNVTAAIASHNKACAACHPSINHTVLHDITRTDNCTGSSCHDGTNLTTLKIGAGSATKHTDCVTCHGASAPSKTKSAIAAGDKSCGACHFTDFTQHVAPSAAHTVSSSGCSTSGCHNTNVATIHATPTAFHPVPIGCLACHDTGKPPLTTDCANAACHPSGMEAIHAPYHTSCNGCHATGFSGTDHDNLMANPYERYLASYGCWEAWACHGSPWQPVGVHSYNSGCDDGCH